MGMTTIEIIFWIMVQCTIVLTSILIGYAKGWKEGTQHGFRRGLIRATK